MSSLLKVIENPDELDYFKDGLKDRDISKLCKGQIGEEFIEYEKLNADYMVIHYTNSNTESIRGFAFVNEDEDKDGKFLYISLICNLNNHNMKTRTAAKGRSVGGRDIIESVINLAKNKHIDRVKLSAIDSVITYYKKLGFDFDNKPSRKRKIENILKGLSSTDAEKRKKSLDVLYSYQKGYFNEHNQSKRNPKSFITDTGISMTIKTKKSASSKSKSKTKSANSRSKRSNSVSKMMSKSKRTRVQGGKRNSKRK